MYGTESLPPSGKTFITRCGFPRQRDERNCLCNISNKTPLRGQRLSAMAARATRIIFLSCLCCDERSQVIATCRSLFSDIYAQLTVICIFTALPSYSQQPVFKDIKNSLRRWWQMMSICRISSFSGLQVSLSFSFRDEWSWILKGKFEFRIQEIQEFW